MSDQVKKLNLLVIVWLIFTSSAAQWKIYISNDACIDYTWALTEQQVHDYTAYLIAAHLDAMKITDNEPWYNQSRYNFTTANEIFFFLEKFPEREKELAARIREGRITLSPFLVNTNWGFQGAEGFLRGLYPAKRFALKHNLKLEYAVHSELPSLPWGVITLLAGSGIRWVNKPFLNYDATFGSLINPPIFRMAGPDNSTLNVILDKHASSKYCYMQGGGLLKIPPYEKDTATISHFWLPWYSNLTGYPLKAVLAEGTHCDLSVNSSSQAMEIAKKIIEFNRQFIKPVILVNSTFKMFTDNVDSVQKSTPFMQTIKGSFGHSWELWPLALAKYAVNMRKGENRLISAEALLASSAENPFSDPHLLRIHRRAEWLLAMLNDHAWNGSDSANIKSNSDIRKRFSSELLILTDSLVTEGFRLNGLRESKKSRALFNPVNYSRTSIAEIPLDYNSKSTGVFHGDREMESQVIVRGEKRSLIFKSDPIKGYGFHVYNLKHSEKSEKSKSGVSAGFRIKTDGKNGIEIRDSKSDELISTIRLRHLSDSYSDPIYSDPVLISEGDVATVWLVEGNLPFAAFSTEIMIDKNSRNIGINLLINKEINTRKEAIYFVCSLPERAKLVAETTAATDSPYMAPRGDYLPGADTSRIAIQGFVMAGYGNGKGLVLSSPDAFCLKPAEKEIIIQLLGNNHNFREAIKDQNGETEFRFNFELAPFEKDLTVPLAHKVGFLNQHPLLISSGLLTERNPEVTLNDPLVKVISFKPADPESGSGKILKLWNTSAQEKTASIQLSGNYKVFETDLLEQDLSPLPVPDRTCYLKIKPFGFRSIRIKD